MLHLTRMPSIPSQQVCYYLLSIKNLNIHKNTRKYIIWSALITKVSFFYLFRCCRTKPQAATWKVNYQESSNSFPQGNPQTQITGNSIFSFIMHQLHDGKYLSLYTRKMRAQKTSIKLNPSNCHAYECLLCN